jgi:hypothetical protein
MQKVVGSSPIIRSKLPANARVLFFTLATMSRILSQAGWTPRTFPPGLFRARAHQRSQARLRIFAGGSHVGVSPSLTRARGAQCNSCSLKFILVLVAEIVLET